MIVEVSAQVRTMNPQCDGHLKKDALSLWRCLIIDISGPGSRKNTRCMETFRVSGGSNPPLKATTDPTTLTDSGSCDPADRASEEHCSGAASEGTWSASHAKRSSASSAFQMSAPLSGVPVPDEAHELYASASTVAAKWLHSACRRRMAARDSLSCCDPMASLSSRAVKMLTLSSMFTAVGC